jgi:hypothetical protein
VNETPSTAVVWFGVLGGPVAWAVQFVANLWFGFARCDGSGRWRGPVAAWGIGLSVAALVVGITALAVSASLFRRTDVGEVRAQVVRGFGGPPPVARVHFLAIVGLVVNPLALAIVAMTAVGAPLLTLCQQS